MTAALIVSLAILATGTLLAAHALGKRPEPRRLPVRSRRTEPGRRR